MPVVASSGDNLNTAVVCAVCEKPEAEWAAVWTHDLCWVVTHVCSGTLIAVIAVRSIE